MRIATWNINSVRLRAPIVLDFLKSHDPDILCLQETKTPDEHFPFKAFKDTPYQHIHIHGMKGYNGVAILSKFPLDEKEIHHRVGKEDCRHIMARFTNPAFKKPIDIHNLYIPAGGDDPDPAINEKFAHKLAFLDELTQWFPKHYKKDDAVIAVGDFNIAPYEHDVWSHKQLLKVISHTPIEVEKLGQMQDALDWIDAAREFVPMDEKLYSWWSYRTREWPGSNRGRRLDHIWVTQALKPHLKSHETYIDARGWEKPSDHVPVLIDFDF